MGDSLSVLSRNARIFILGGCLGLALPAFAEAQTPPEAIADPSPSETRRPDPARATRAYFGMWTSHLKEDRHHVPENNWVVGAAFRGYFGATFLNSYGRRAYTGGLQRSLITVDYPPGTASLGYRLGFVTGYDGRLMAIAGKTPILPLIQPFVSTDIGHIGVEVSYTFVVVSIATSYRF